MDFPDVTHVIQVGAPRDGEFYIHRVGRTGRGDKEGVGYIFMSDVEYTPEVEHMLSGIPFVEDEKPLQLANLDLSQEQTLPKSQAELLLTLSNTSLHRVDEEKKTEAYRSLLGYYNGNYKTQGEKQTFADALNRWPQVSWGMETPPNVRKILLTKLGFGKIAGFQAREESSGFRGGSRNNERERGRDSRSYSRDRRSNDRPYGRSSDKPYARSSDKPYERSNDRPYERSNDRPYGRGGNTKFNDRRDGNKRYSDQPKKYERYL
jgi:ATP-dependent RNA helicase MSS116